MSVVLPLAALLAPLLSSSPGSEEPAPTFTEHVAPIIFERCTSCHRPGEVGPFPLMNFEDVRRRGRMVARVTRDRLMPPWPPARGVGDFLGDLSLTDEQIATLQRWVEADMPEGDPARLPSLPEFAEGWQLGEPDLVVQMPQAFDVPAGGPDIYRSFAIPLGLTQDRWLTAIEVRPSSPSLHHIVFHYDTSGQARALSDADGMPGFDDFSLGTSRQRVGRGRGDQTFGLAGWAVGGAPHHLPNGLALFLPKGGDLLLQSHFQPQGKPVSERTVLGLHFTDVPPTRSLIGIELPPDFGAVLGIDIPAGQADYVLEDEIQLPVDTLLVSVFPHAHMICRDFEVTTTDPAGATNTILRIDQWDFDWQSTYMYREPLVLPAGTVVKCRIRYDNSAANPANPFDPPRRMRWGLQSTDEMGSVFLTVVARNGGEGRALVNAVQAHESRQRKESHAVNAVLRSRFEIMDRNGDGQVQLEEIPKTLENLARHDTNHDGVIDAGEIEVAIGGRQR